MKNKGDEMLYAEVRLGRLINTGVGKAIRAQF